MSGRALASLLFLLAIAAVANMRFATARAAPVSALQITGPDSVSPETPFNVTVMAVDSSGQTDTGFADTVHLTSTGSAIPPPDYTFTPVDAGVHSFTLALSTTGAQIIGVQDLSNASVGIATTIVTNGAAATVAASSSSDVPPPIVRSIITFGAPPTPNAPSLVISGPSHVQTITPFTVSISANDANGLPLADFRDTVHLTASGSATLLPRDYGFMPADTGLKGFTLVFLLPGPHILGVQDITNPNVASGTSVITADEAVTSGPPPAATAAPVAAVTPTPAQSPAATTSTLVKGTPVQSPPGAPTGTSQTATATCPLGKGLLSGGGTVTTSDTPTNQQRVALSQSFPSSDTGASAVWTVVGVVGISLSANERMNVTAYALCQS